MQMLEEWCQIPSLCLYSGIWRWQAPLSCYGTLQVGVVLLLLLISWSRTLLLLLQMSY